MRRGGSWRRQGSSGSSGGSARRLDTQASAETSAAGGDNSSSNNNWRRQGSTRSGGGGNGSARRFSTQAQAAQVHATSGDSNSTTSSTNGSNRAQSARPGLQRSGGGGGGGNGSARRSGRRSAPTDLSEQEIRGLIQSSSVQLAVSLQLDVGYDTALEANIRAFRALFPDDGLDDDAAMDSSDADVARVKLAVFGLNNWEEQVAFDRVVASLRRPSSADGVHAADATLPSRARVACAGEWKYELSLSPDAIDSLWAFTNALVLQLRSAGILGRALLPVRGNHPIVLASGVSKQSPFASGESKCLDWSGAMPWDAIAVADASSSNALVQLVQLVRLPPAVTVASAPLRYPALEPLVDELLRENARTRKPAVVILRGIPGSGKSTFGREIAALCTQRAATSCIISADRYFVGARGYVFDVKHIGKAHDICKQQFDDALRRAAANIVVVDNTHTQQWEFEPYITRARASGSAVRVLEMRCADLTTCMRMAARNTHGVLLPKVIQMYLRWEDLPSDSVLAFEPQFEHALVTANPVSRSAASSVVYVGLFIDASARATLLRAFPPVHANVFGEHVTFYYRPSNAYVRRVEIGEHVVVRAEELVQDARGQSLRVAFERALPLQLRNKVPHITLSTANSVSAYYSNELLQDASAQRTTLASDQQLNIPARVGVAVLTQNKRVTTLRPPFDSTAATTCGVVTRVVGLCIDGVSLKRALAAVQTREQLLARLSLREQLVHLMGSACTTHRVLCLVATEVSSAMTDAMLAQFESLLLLSPEHHQHFAFDAVVSAVDASQATAVLHDACARVMASHAVKQIVLLTSLPQHVTTAFSGDKRFNTAAVDVSVRCVTLPCESQASASGGLAAPFPLSLVGAMDCLNMGVQERTRHAIHAGTRLAQTAWHSVLQQRGVSSSGGSVVERIDSSLVGLDAAVVDLCAVADIASSEFDLLELQHELVQALTATGAQHVLMGRAPDCVYFQACMTNALHAPVFRVQLAASSDSESSVFKRLAFCKSQRQRMHSLRETESCVALVALLRAILRARCSQVQGDLAATLALDLVSETLVLDYLLQTRATTNGDSSSEGGGSGVGGNDETAAAEGETDVLRLLLQLLEHLSGWASARWTQATDAALAVLDSGDMTAFAALAAVPSAAATCLRIIRDFETTNRGVIYKHSTADKRSTETLELLLALLSTPMRDAEQRAQGVVHVLNASSALDIVAVCDAMLAAARDHARSIACAPSRLYAQSVQIVAQSQELLAQIVADAQDAAVATQSALEHLELRVSC